MERLKRSREGFTLMELVIVIMLGFVILLTASNFLINFGKYSSNVVKSEAGLMGTTLGSYEEIVYLISQASKVVVGAEAAMDVPSTARPSGCLTDGTCIQIRVDKVGPTTPSDFTDDTVYNYWKSSSGLYKSSCTTAGGCTASTLVSSDLSYLSFSRPSADKNTVRVVLYAEDMSGGTEGVLRESLSTIVTLSGQSGN
jgi:hypothetical protein